MDRRSFIQTLLSVAVSAKFVRNAKGIEVPELAINDNADVFEYDPLPPDCAVCGSIRVATVRRKPPLLETNRGFRYVTEGDGSKSIRLYFDKQLVNRAVFLYPVDEKEAWTTLCFVRKSTNEFVEICTFDVTKAPISPACESDFYIMVMEIPASSTEVSS